MGNSCAFGRQKNERIESRLEEGSAPGAAGLAAVLSPPDRRAFLQGTVAAAATFALPRWAVAHPGEFEAIRAEIEKRHDESVKRLQDWIRLPSIAAENRSMNEGCELMMRLLRDAGFEQVSKVPTDGHPGVFATLDAGTPKTLGLYFMYDVKQADPAEWSSPPSRRIS